MLLRWRGVDCLCATMLVLLTYFKTSTGDNMTTVLTTTELATTAAEPTTVATTTVTTVALTTQLPNLNPPGNVSVADVPSNNTAFTVSWDDDQDPRLTVTYNIIIVNTTDGSETDKFDDVQSVYTVTARTPGQEYGVTVVAVDDDNSREEHSDEKTITLQPNKVERLRRQDSSNTSVAAVWNEPLNSVFDSYDISCSSGTAVPMTITKGGMLEASCNDVMPGRLHTITVATVSGSRSNSDDVDIWSKPNTVRDLEGGNVTTDSVSVEWNQPDDHIDSYYYIVDCSEGFADDENITDGTTTATCSPVTAGSLVTVTVTTYSGLESNADNTTVRAKPNSVGALDEETASTDSVTASWLAPGGEVTQYNISCSHGNPEPPEVTDDDRSTEYSATCVNISPPGTECTVMVTSVSDTVAGDSRSIKITTYPIPPVLVEAASTETSISVEWQKPDSMVDYYIIECSNGTASPSNIIATDGTLTASCIGLTLPGDLYSISVQSQSNDKLSDAATEIINALPENVTLVKSPSLVDTVSATWERPRGVFEQFYVQCAPTDNAVPLEDVIPYDQDASSYAANCSVSIPGDVYNMTVISRSGNQNSSASTIELRALPESVKTFEVAQYTDTMASLSWTIKDKCIPDGHCVWSSFEVSYNSSNATQIPRDSRATPVESLTPGDYYVFFISVKSEEEVSSAETVSQRLRPSNVRSVDKKVIDKRVVTIEWDSPDGVVTGYDTTIESLEAGRGGGESGGFDGDLNEQKHTATFVDLTPGLEYTITVCTKSYDEICITPASISIETLPDKPSAPQDLSLEEENIQTVIVTFSEPALPNGDITEYIIRYSGVKDGSPNQEEITESYTPEGNPPYSVTISDLVAGYTYTFKVTAVNDAGEGAVAEGEITLSQLKPLNSTVPPEVVAESVDTDIWSFSVMFSSEWFSHCNGELQTYSVFVVEEGGDETNGDPPRSYKEAQNEKPLPVYVAIANETYPFAADYSSCATQRKKRQASESIEVVIGDETCSDDGRYCNGALHGNREYRVKYQACNDVGCSETDYSEVIKTDLNNASWLVPLIFILIVLICALAIFVVWKERQQPGIITNHFKRPKSGIDNRGFDHDKPMRRQGDNRPVKLAEFGQFLEDMSRDSDYLFSEEYNDLRPIGKNQSTDAAQLEVNRVKNRFSNILPYDHTRVTLSPVDDEEGSDYINANYMLGYKSQREYIACQGPLQSTEEDMWRLVWEQGASIIVMVTQLMENGKIKCHQYWPDEGEGPVRYGEIVVNPMKVQKEQLWTIRKFQITKGPVTRTVTHFNFIAWPDHGVPERPDDLIKFVQAVRECKKMDGKPVVVHCSAGVGRTGTFISLDHLMSAMKEKDEVDIYGMVRSMRMNRCMMVQTESQYIFIHQCVMALLEGSVENDAVYENVNGNGYFSEALI